MRKLTDICPDFNEWPERWMGIEKDLVYGRQMLEVLEPFVVFLAESNLSDKTVKNHLANLWLLGGEIIRDVSLQRQYSIPAVEILLQSIDAYGGLHSHQLETEAQIRSYDSTCKKLYKFMEGKKK